MKRTFLILLTIAVAVALGFSQGKVTRQKSTKTEQTTQQSAHKRKSNAEANRRKEAEEAKLQQEAEEKHRQEEEARKRAEEEYKPTGEISGHGYVDLGLPSGTKWATCNIGATTPESYGDYFAWGETKPKSEYTEEKSITYRKDNEELMSMGIIDSSRNLTPAYDAAHVNWGGSWRIPTRSELIELKEKCEWVWTPLNDIEGYKVTGPNGKSIFLSAAGFRHGISRIDSGSNGYYWSSSPEHPNHGCALNFHSSDRYVHFSDRCDGIRVRAVSN